MFHGLTGYARDHHQKMIDFVGFDNDLPRRPLVVGLDHEPALDETSSL